MRTGQVEGAGCAMLRVLSTPGLQLSVITLGSPGHRDLPGNFLQSQDSESLTPSGDTVTSDQDEGPGGDARVLHNTPLLRRYRGWTNTEQRVTSEQQQEETVIQIILYPAAVIEQKMEREIQSRSGS